MKKGSVAIIPARYGSTRFPGKPLVHICGMTLLERTYRQVLLCPEISRCIIATDDDRIKQHALEFGAEVVMTSPHCQTGTDRIAEVVSLLPELQEASAIVNVQGDEPCIDPKTITKVIEVLFSSDDFSVGTIVAPIQREEDLNNTNIVKCVKAINGKALYFSRSIIPGSKNKCSIKSFPYMRHLGIYAFRPKFLLSFATLSPTPLQLAEDLEMLRAMEHGYSIGVAEINKSTPDVNTKEDIEEVSRWIESQSFCSSQAE
jgi:3-deoxy-manno-octulosonate cytidylyltransferase (CMP-KDO synthetase)